MSSAAANKARLMKALGDRGRFGETCLLYRRQASLEMIAEPCEWRCDTLSVQAVSFGRLESMPLPGGSSFNRASGSKPNKLHQVLVGCAIVVGFAILRGEGCPLVEHACQNHVVVQTNAKAPGWALSQINKVMLRFHCFHSSTVSTTMETLDKMKLNAR